VLAAAVAAEATVLCTSNIKDFPAHAVAALGFEVLAPDQLLSRLVTEYAPQMVAAHHTAVASLKGATDQSTVEALDRAGAPVTADLMIHLLELG
jgi:predicted outer membrane protein